MSIKKLLEWITGRELFEVPKLFRRVAYDPKLIPPMRLMRLEGIYVLEEWFRWAEEWSMLLRVYGGIRRDSSVLEIGCGLGRIAFALRFILSPEGTYDGFEIDRRKVEFLRRNFQAAYPNFRFVHADISNSYYNPRGTLRPEHYRFPYRDASFDVIYAASVFTHLVPETARHYLSEAARVLKPGGRCVFSFFLLDYYRPGRPRPFGFNRESFNVDHPFGGHGDDFAVSNPKVPEQVSAYRLAFVENLAARAGLRLAQPAIPGVWSGTSPTWVGTQDVLVLVRAGVPDSH